MHVLGRHGHLGFLAGLGDAADLQGLVGGGDGHGGQGVAFVELHQDDAAAAPGQLVHVGDGEHQQAAAAADGEQGFVAVEGPRREDGVARLDADELLAGLVAAEHVADAAGEAVAAGDGQQHPLFGVAADHLGHLGAAGDGDEGGYRHAVAAPAGQAGDGHGAGPAVGEIGRAHV